MKNLFTGIPASLPEEHILALVDTATVRIERIVSRGHASPQGFWYDQDQNEFVLLLSGEAKLLFQDQLPAEVTLRPGDSLVIPAHCRHRVEWTAPGIDSVWLTVFYP